MIKIGTSGYSFKDWKGTFYPEDVASKDMLGYYAQRFDIVEVNATYYRLLPASTFEGMVQKTPDGFEFVVKANQATTHEGTDEGVVKEFTESFQPLVDAGRFRGILAQFPWGFRNTPKNRDYLVACRSRMRDVPYFVEFRHNSWLTPEVGDLLKANELGYVCVDEPQIGQMVPPIATATTDTGYVRFHGRNKRTWWNKEAGDRYDYLYSEEELEAWVGKIRNLIEKTKDILVFFNNCHDGQAPRNAQQLRLMLGV
jgi:uncharacterized protein YecE (DUF72 family)